MVTFGPDFDVDKQILWPITTFNLADHNIGGNFWRKTRFNAFF